MTQSNLKKHNYKISRPNIYAKKLKIIEIFIVNLNFTGEKRCEII